LEKLTGTFRGLANPDRLRIVYLLAMSEMPLCVCEIVEALGLPQYQVSKHLRTLRGLNLIESRREGRWAYYSLARTQRVRRLAGFLIDSLPRQGMGEELDRLHKRLELRNRGKCTVKPRRAKREPS